MRCSKAKILLSASLDGELVHREQQALEQHLARCSRCADERSVLLSLREKMLLWTDEEPSESLAPMFLARLYELQSEKSVAVGPRRRAWAFVAVTATIAACVVLAIFVLRGMFPHDGQSVSRVQPDISNIETKTPPPVVPSDTKVVSVTQPSRGGVQPKTLVQPARVAEVPVVLRPRPARQPKRGMVEVSPQNVSVNSEEQNMAKAALVKVGLAEGNAFCEITDNLGEIGLSVNETVERVRGSLQMAVDLVRVTPPLDGEVEINSNGGTTL